MTRIAAVMPVTPVPLICAGLSREHKGPGAGLRAFVGQAVETTGTTSHPPRWTTPWRPGSAPDRASDARETDGCADGAKR